MSEINRQIAQTPIAQRKNLIVWVDRNSNQHKLLSYGDVVYFSKKMHYSILYVDASQAEKICDRLRKQNFVKKAVVSQRDDLHFDAAYQENMMAHLKEEAERLRAENEDLRV
jgi:uncharacterized protein YlbG (UPF0298 family)